MKVNIKHVEKKKGMVFSKKLHGVECSLQFNDEETAIIDERKLKNQLLLERDWSADVDGEKQESRGLVSLVAKAAIQGAGANHPHLTIGKLARGADTHFFDTPVEAKMYAEELKDALKLCKGFIEGNAEAGTDDSFEL